MDWQLVFGRECATYGNNITPLEGNSADGAVGHVTAQLSGTLPSLHATENRGSRPTWSPEADPKSRKPAAHGTVSFGCWSCTRWLRFGLVSGCRSFSRRIFASYHGGILHQKRIFGTGFEFAGSAATEPGYQRKGHDARNRALRLPVQRRDAVQGPPAGLEWKETASGVHLAMRSLVGDGMRLFLDLSFNDGALYCGCLHSGLRFPDIRKSVSADMALIQPATLSVE